MTDINLDDLEKLARRTLPDERGKYLVSVIPEEVLALIRIARAAKKFHESCKGKYGMVPKELYESLQEIEA